MPILITIRVEMIKSKTLDTLRSADLAGRRRVLLNQSRGYGFGHRQEEPSVTVMMSPLGTSESQKELKCSVSV